MKPEEILNEWERLLKLGLSIHEYHPCKETLIEAIKQYAREMCDKQKRECIEKWNETEDEDAQVAYNAMTTAPYPKELL